MMRANSILHDHLPSEGDVSGAFSALLGTSAQTKRLLQTSTIRSTNVPTLRGSAGGTVLTIADYREPGHVGLRRILCWYVEWTENKPNRILGQTVAVGRQTVRSFGPDLKAKLG